MHGIMHRIHTLRARAGAALVLLVAVVAFAIGGGALAAGSGVRSDDHLYEALLTVAEVLGGVTGILIAVVVFGVQFHGERLGELSFLVRYLGRYEGLVPIAALTLAVIAANLLVALIASIWLPHAARLMVVLDLFLAPLVLVLTLWLFYRMVVSVSGDFFREGLLPGLTWEYLRGIDEEAFVAAMDETFRKEISKDGCEYNPWFGLWTRHSPEEDVSLGKLRPGRVVDIDIAALRSALSEIRTCFPNLRIIVTAGPDDAVEDIAALWVAHSPRQFGEPRREKPMVPDAVRLRVEQAIEDAYVVAADRERELPEMLRRFSRALVSQAAHDRPDQLRRGLEVLEELIRLRMLRPDAPKLPASSLHALPDYLGEYDYHDIAKAVVESADEAKIEAMISFASRLMGIGATSLNRDLFTRGGELAALVYLFAARTDKASSAASLIDSAINTNASPLFHAKEELKGEFDPAQDALRVAATRWILLLLKAAVDSDRPEDASDFLDRLQQIRERSGRLARRAESGKPFVRLEVYAEILVSGWCLKIAKNAVTAKGAAKATARRVAAETVGQIELLEVWESTPQATDGGDLVMARNWEFSRLRFRAGMAYTTSGSTDWPLDGLMALLLAKYKSPGRLRRRTSESRPTAPPLDDGPLKSICDALLADDVMRKECLAIEDGKQEEALDTVRKLFAQQRRMFKLADLRRVVEPEVSLPQVHALRAEISDTIESKRPLWIRGLLQNERLGPAMTTYWPVPSRSGMSWKELFIAEPKRIGYWSEGRAEELTSQEERALVWGAEWDARPVGTIAELAALPAAVRAAIQGLRDKGHSPSLVFLPGQERFGFALFGVPEWEYPGRRRDEPRHLGQWDGCNVYAFPYLDVRSIFVVDGSRFFGRNDLGERASVEVMVEDPKRAEHLRLLKEGEAEPDDAKIATPNDVHVDLKTFLFPSLGFANLDAGAAVALDLSTLGYALRKGEDVYHRPDCRLLGADVAAHRLSASLEWEPKARKPCEVCRPDDWDDAPSMEEIGGIGAGEMHRPREG